MHLKEKILGSNFYFQESPNRDGEMAITRMKYSYGTQGPANMFVSYKNQHCNELILCLKVNKLSLSPIVTAQEYMVKPYDILWYAPLLPTDVICNFIDR